MFRCFSILKRSKHDIKHLTISRTYMGKEANQIYIKYNLRIFRLQRTSSLRIICLGPLLVPKKRLIYVRSGLLFFYEFSIVFQSILICKIINRNILTQNIINHFNTWYDRKFNNVYKYHYRIYSLETTQCFAPAVLHIYRNRTKHANRTYLSFHLRILVVPCKFERYFIWIYN